MSPARPNVSVVDDEQPILKALSRLLRADGFEVQVFTSGLAFLSSLQTQRPDCVLLDLHMPELSGLEVQARLHQEHVDVPVIAITGRDDPGLCERVLNAGAAAYLTKPLEEEDLVRAINDVVHRHASERASREEMESIRCAG